jgi:hypothetical protein
MESSAQSAPAWRRVVLQAAESGGRIVISVTDEVCVVPPEIDGYLVDRIVADRSYGLCR